VTIIIAFHMSNHRDFNNNETYLNWFEE